MRIAFVTQWFDPEGGSAAIPGAMVRALEARGNRMEVVTGYPNYPTGDLHEGYRVRLHTTEQHGGTKVHRVPLYPSHDRSAVLRAANFVSFMLSSATIGALLARRSQVTLVYATPATVGLAGVVLRRLLGRPFVVYVQDLWPDTVIATGMLPRRLERIISLALEPFCRLVYRSASRVAVISPGMKRLLVARGVAESKIDVIYNWVDDRLFHPEPGNAPNECFRVMYAGNLGDVQGLETLVKAVATLDDLPDLEVVLVGGGVAEQRLRTLVISLGLERRVLFEGAKPTCEMSLLMARAHVQVVSLKDLPLFHVTMPSKVQAILACGLPLIICAPGDAAELVRSSGAGICAVPSNVEHLADAIRAAYGMKGAALNAMGRAGRTFYERELSAEVGAKKLEASLRRAYSDSVAS
jgi:glycosyltransferase involved in cell wall biosynthesis